MTLVYCLKVLVVSFFAVTIPAHYDVDLNLMSSSFTIHIHDT